MPNSCIKTDELFLHNLPIWAWCFGSNAKTAFGATKWSRRNKKQLGWSRPTSGPYFFEANSKGGGKRKTKEIHLSQSFKTIPFGNLPVAHSTSRLRSWQEFPVAWARGEALYAEMWSQAEGECDLPGGMRSSRLGNLGKCDVGGWFCVETLGMFSHRCLEGFHGAFWVVMVE